MSRMGRHGDTMLCFSIVSPGPQMISNQTLYHSRYQVIVTALLKHEVHVTRPEAMPP